MNETLVIAFTAFFATIGPIDVAVMYPVLSRGMTPRQRWRTAVRAVFLASCLLYAFALFGQMLLDRLGISIPALQTAGGILLFLVGLDMVFARHSGVASTTEDEDREAREREDIAVFPLATPLIAGPGAIGAAILLMTNAGDNRYQQLAVVSSLGFVLLLTLILMFMAGQVQRLLGVTGMNVVSRIFGLLLTALAVQFVFDGIKGSGLINL
ncbi:MAG TPA: antibiotic resistance protein MarC [Gammaproteobacteria bacterium]|nr:MAG: antibiotic resistance protein MarC [Candidatus Thioglobus sp. MED-G23]RPF99628.1 MAG: MarC family protein [Proteobacteria bacterium TMED51]HAU40600.1 antibiotic resistance protein MarC [Gammaproteobacteria bacterium]